MAFSLLKTIIFLRKVYTKNKKMKNTHFLGGIFLEERKVSWLELFYDLVFVVAISSTNHLLTTVNHQPQDFFMIIGEYLLMIIPMWWAWAGQTMFFNRYGHRLKKPHYYMFMQMFFVMLMTASFNLNFNETYLTFLIGFIGIRFMTILQYHSVKRCIDTKADQKVILLLTNFFTLSLILSSTSLFFTGFTRYFVLFLGIFLDIAIPLINHKKLTAAPVDVGHLAERLGLFTLICFGETVVALIAILNGQTMIVSTLFYVGIAFIVIVLLWKSYYDRLDLVIDKEQTTNGQLLLYSNLFMLIAITLFAAALHLGAHQVLPLQLIDLLLAFAFFLFYSAKHFIFIYHPKKKFSRATFRKIIGLGLSICLLAGFLLYLVVPPIWMLILIGIASLIDNLIQYEEETSV